MVLNSNRKNVVKIASSCVFLPWSPSYQPNGVEDGLLVMENTRDGLKSNINWIPIKRFLRRRLYRALSVARIFANRPKNLVRRIWHLISPSCFQPSSQNGIKTQKLTEYIIDSKSVPKKQPKLKVTEFDQPELKVTECDLKSVPKEQPELKVDEFTKLLEEVRSHTDMGLIDFEKFINEKLSVWELFLKLSMKNPNRFKAELTDDEINLVTQAIVKYDKSGFLEKMIFRRLDADDPKFLFECVKEKLFDCVRKEIELKFEEGCGYVPERLYKMLRIIKENSTEGDIKSDVAKWRKYLETLTYDYRDAKNIIIRVNGIFKN